MLEIVLNAVHCKLALDAVAGAADTDSLRVAALDHKATDHTVEDDTVIESFADEVGKVACSYRHVVAQFNDDVTKRCLQFYSCHEYKVYRNDNKYEHFSALFRDDAAERSGRIFFSETAGG